MMEWIYGSNEGEAKGSPAVVDRKLARKGRQKPERSEEQRDHGELVG